MNQFPLLPNKPILPASRKSKSFLIALAISLGLFSAPLLQAQGCIVARSPDADVRTPVDWLLRDAPVLLRLRSSSGTELLPVQRLAFQVASVGQSSIY